MSETTKKTRLDAPGPWSLHAGWEQGEPGWYISAGNTQLVLVLSDEVPLSMREANAVLKAIAEAHCVPWVPFTDDDERKPRDLYGGL